MAGGSAGSSSSSSKTKKSSSSSGGDSSSSSSKKKKSSDGSSGGSSSSKKSSSKKRKLTPAEARLHFYITENKVATQVQIDAAFPDIALEERIQAINGLARLSLIRLQTVGGELQYEAASKQEASVMAELEGNDLLVYTHIRDSGNEGIWTKTIKVRANLHQTVVNRCLKSLEQKHLIKTVKNVKFPTRKIVMLANLEPSSELSGGPWYSDTELDEAFIEAISNVCLRFIQERTWPDAGMKRLLYPASHVFNLPTAGQILEHARATKIFGVTLSLENMSQLLDTLIYDEKIEKVPILPGQQRTIKSGTAAASSSSSSSHSRKRANGEGSGGKGKKRKRSSSSRHDSDSGSGSEDEESADGRGRRDADSSETEHSHSEDDRGRGKHSDGDDDDDESDHARDSSRSKKKGKHRSSSRSSSSGHKRKRKRSSRSRSYDHSDSESESSESGSESDSSSASDSRRRRDKRKRKRSSSKSRKHKRRRRSESEDEDSGHDDDFTASSSSEDGGQGPIVSDDEEADPTYGAEALDAFPFVYRALRPMHVFSPWQTDLVRIPGGTTAAAAAAGSGEFGTGSAAASWMQMPCGQCPISRFCESGGPVNAEGCEYFDQWIEAGLEGMKVDAADDDDEEEEDEDMDELPDVEVRPGKKKRVGGVKDEERDGQLARR